MGRSSSSGSEERLAEDSEGDRFEGLCDDFDRGCLDGDCEEIEEDRVGFFTGDLNGRCGEDGVRVNGSVSGLRSRDGINDSRISGRLFVDA